MSEDLPGKIRYKFCGVMPGVIAFCTEDRKLNNGKLDFSLGLISGQGYGGLLVNSVHGALL